MYIHVCMYVYVCICIYIHVCVCVYVCVCMFIYIYKQCESLTLGTAERAEARNDTDGGRQVCFMFTT